MTAVPWPAGPELLRRAATEVRTARSVALDHEAVQALAEAVAARNPAARRIRTARRPPVRPRRGRWDRRPGTAAALNRIRLDDHPLDPSYG
jgi:hypothetical protein